MREAKMRKRNMKGEGKEEKQIVLKWRGAQRGFRKWGRMWRGSIRGVIRGGGRGKGREEYGEGKEVKEKERVN